MPSLVQKWQNIQKELDEEENSSSSDEDRGVLSQKRIDEWKVQQLTRYVTPAPFHSAKSASRLFCHRIRITEVTTFYFPICGGKNSRHSSLWDFPLK